MSFLQTNIGKDTKVLVKAKYNPVILAPIIAQGALIALIGYIIKKYGLFLIKTIIE